MSELRLCTMCNERKEEDLFKFKTKSNTGSCKECRKKYEKEWMVK